MRISLYDTRHEVSGEKQWSKKSLQTFYCMSFKLSPFKYSDDVALDPFSGVVCDTDD